MNENGNVKVFHIFQTLHRSREIFSQHVCNHSSIDISCDFVAYTLSDNEAESRSSDSMTRYLLAACLF